MLSKEEISKIRYCNLHLHSHFSILDGVGTIKDHICENLHKGHEGVAITDHGVMSGCIQLYKLSKDKDFLKKIGRDSSIPVVMGSELYITRNVGEQNPENKYNHITVLAKNAKGYSNLCELTSIASTPDHFYYRPRIELKELIEHKEGLVVTSGCFIGMIPQAIHRDTGEEEELVQLFKKEFGDDFYIEIHISDISSKWDKTLKKHVNQGWNPQEKVNRRLIELAKKYDVKTIIAQDSHMPKKEHHFIQSIMIWNSPSGKDGWHFPEAYYTMSVQEMYDKSRKTTPYIDDDLFIESCNNSVEVLDKCKNCKLEFEPLLPTMKYDEHPVNCEPELNKKLEDQLNALEKEYAEKDHEFSYLLEKSHNDLALRTSLKVIMNNNKIDIHKQEYRERLTFETNTIQRNGILKLVDYFMLLEDVTKFVRESGNARGFGRGCLDRDALVLTQEHGYRKISEIKEGDHVYTKDGECKPVLMTFIYDVDQHETLLKISTEKSFGSITFTKNHKIYGIKPELTKKVMNSSSNHKIKKYNIKDNPEWIEAKDLSVNDFLFVSYPNREIINQEDVNLSKYVEFPYAVEGSDIVKLNPLTKREESRFSSMIKFDKEFSYFVGKWVGNGWITYDESRREYGVGIGFNSKDTIEINKMVSYLKNLGFTPKLIKSKTKFYLYILKINSLRIKTLQILNI
jgi:DNA polymerase-3 subunit alpha